jgi:L-alanine-DL-glutamate epimerase-like enolase superfamily enzyme
MYTRLAFLSFIHKQEIHAIPGKASRTGGMIEVKRIFEPATARDTLSEVMTDLVNNPLDVHDGVVEFSRTFGLGVEIDWDFVAAQPNHGEHGIGVGARPASGLAHETLPDRQVEARA